MFVPELIGERSTLCQPFIVYSPPKYAYNYVYLKPSGIRRTLLVLRV